MLAEMMYAFTSASFDFFPVCRDQLATETPKCLGRWRAVSRVPALAILFSLSLSLSLSSLGASVLGASVSAGECTRMTRRSLLLARSA